jgi:hypothetical protein
LISIVLFLQRELLVFAQPLPLGMVKVMKEKCKSREKENAHNPP